MAAALSSGHGEALSATVVVDTSSVAGSRSLAASVSVIDASSV
jgi:hypothetical protein